MPEEIDPTKPVTSQETVVDTKITTETIDSNGKSIPPNQNLADIFNKIEAGTKAEDAVKEVMDKKPSKDDSNAKEVSVTSSHPDKKEDDKSEEDDKKDDSPSSLSDALDKGQKKDAKLEDKKEDKKVDEEVIPEEELQVLPHDKPKTAKRISALLQKVAKVSEEVATTRKEKEEKEAKLKELEGKLATVKTIDPKTEEEVQEKLKELSMYRRRYELDKDPEVKSKFDDRIESASKSLDSTVPEILAKNGATQGLLDLVKTEGGWVKFSQSNRRITLAGGEEVTAAELADQIVDKLPFSDRKTLDAIVLEQIQLKRDKQRYIEEQVQVADKFFKEREENEAKNRQAFEKSIKDGEEVIAKWQKTVAEHNAFLKEKEVPANATPEQKKAIEEENSYARELNSVLKKNLSTKDLEGMLNIVLESVQYHQQRRETAKLVERTKRLEAELKAKQDEIDSFKKSGKTTPKSGSLIGGGGGSSAKPDAPKKAATIEEAFAAIESGRGLEE
jgi:hypothetical protein